MNKFFLNKKRVFAILAIFIVLNLIVTHFFLDWKFPVKDNYGETMTFIQGGEIDENVHFVVMSRFLNSPLMLFLSIGAGYFTGGNLSGMILVNLIFYFLAIFVFYKLSYLIYESRKISILSVVLFSFHFILSNDGVSYGADMAGWFFFLLGSYFSVQFYYHHKVRKYFYYAVASAVVGILFKEFGALGMISLGMAVIFLDISWWEKLKNILLAAFLFILVPLLYHIGFYLYFDYSYFDWYAYNIEHEGMNRIKSLVKNVLRIYLAGWPIFFYGLWHEIKEFNRKRLIVFGILLPASLTFVIWPAQIMRVIFVFVPLLILISSFGLSKIKNKYLLFLIIVLYVFVNYNIFHIINYLNQLFGLC